MSKKQSYRKKRQIFQRVSLLVENVKSCELVNMGMFFNTIFIHFKTIWIYSSNQKFIFQISINTIRKYTIQDYFVYYSSTIIIVKTNEKKYQH